MNRPLFNTNYEKYEWLMKNGCTNAEDRTWLLLNIFMETETAQRYYDIFDLSKKLL